MVFDELGKIFWDLLESAPAEEREKFLAQVRSLAGENPDLESLIAMGVKYAQLGHMIPDPIVTFNFEIRPDNTLRTVIEGITPQIEHILGYSPQELIGRNVGEFMTSASLKRAESSFDLPILQSRTGAGSISNLAVEVELKRKDGTNVWVQLHGSFTFNNGLPDLFVGVVRDVDKLVYNGTHDEKTGLLNYHPFIDKLTEQLYYVERFNRLGGESNQFAVAVVFADGDYVKLLNGRCNHLVGTEYIIALAQNFSDRRKTDIVCRFGGDEFALAGIVDSQSGADTMLNGLRAKLENKPLLINGEPVYIEDKGSKHKVFLSASFGMAVYPADSMNPDELVKTADIRMKEEKRFKKDNRTGLYSLYPEGHVFVE